VAGNVESQSSSQIGVTCRQGADQHLTSQFHNILGPQLRQQEEKALRVTESGSAIRIRNI
jgi:hypothetical protein